MEERPIGSRGSGIVTDDGAKLVGQGSYGHRGIYDPSPLPKIPPGTTFSPATKKAAWKLVSPPDEK